MEADRPLRILIVEDGPTSAKIIGNILKQRPGAVPEFTVANDLASAREKVQAIRFDVILLDIVLPDSLGVETVRCLREAHPHAPIVVLTSNEDQTLAIRAMHAGSQEFLVKSYLNPNMLWRVILYSMERYQIEQSLEESQNRFADFTDTGSDWFWEMGMDLRFSFLSENFLAVTGLAPEAFLGKSDLEIGTTAPVPVNWSHHLKDMRQLVRFRNFDFAYETPASDLQWFRISGKPRFETNGVFLGYRGTGSDVTLEKFSEWELKRSPNLLEGILSTSLDGFMVLTEIADHAGKTVDFKFTMVNRRAEEMIGRTRQDLLGKLFRPEMPHMVAHGLFERATQTLKTGASFDVEHFYNTPTMKGWFHIVGVKLDANVVITLADISAHKEAEREQRLAAAVFETSAEAMMVTDAGNRIIAVNSAFTRVTGYTKDDVMGSTPHILSSGCHSREFYQEMWRELDEAGHWFGEIWDRHKSGGVYMQRLTISVIRNDRGDITNFVAVFSDITEEKRETERLHYQANHDALTGLPNRALLQDRLSYALSVFRREASGVAVLMIDLDGFKPVNDDFGHLMGDQLLREVANRLRKCVRESDTVARHGGDEFVVVGLGVHCVPDAEKLATNILESLTVPFRLGDDVEATIGASIGIALFPAHGNDMHELLDRADRAMYEAKGRGKGQFITYRPDMAPRRSR